MSAINGFKFSLQTLKGRGDLIEKGRDCHASLAMTIQLDVRPRFARNGHIIVRDCFTSFATEDCSDCSERGEGIFFTPRDDTLYIGFLIVKMAKITLKEV